MRKLIPLLLAATLLSSIDVWAATQAATAPTAKTNKAKKCLFPHSRKRAPDWVCSARADGLSVAAVGSSAKSGAGNSFMEQMAAADARANLAKSVRASVQNKIANSEGVANKAETGADGELITKITSDSLQNAKVVNRAYGPDGKLYVLVGMDEANTQLLIDSITAEYQAQKRK